MLIYTAFIAKHEGWKWDKLARNCFLESFQTLIFRAKNEYLWAKLVEHWGCLMMYIYLKRIALFACGLWEQLPFSTKPQTCNAFHFLLLLCSYKSGISVRGASHANQNERPKCGIPSPGKGEVAQQEGLCVGIEPRSCVMQTAVNQDTWISLDFTDFYMV